MESENAAQLGSRAISTPLGVVIEVLLSSASRVDGYQQEAAALLTKHPSGAWCANAHEHMQKQLQESAHYNVVGLCGNQFHVRRNSEEEIGRAHV